MLCGGTLYDGARYESSNSSNALVLWVCIHSAIRCLSPRLPYRPHIYLLAFCFAQRLRCASPIFFRPAALIVRRLRSGAAAVAFLAPSLESKARACLIREISKSIDERILSSVMPTSISRLPRMVDMKKDILT